MPFQRDREKKESTTEEMEIDDHEQEASSSEEDDSDTSSVSEDGDSSGKTKWNVRGYSVSNYMQTLILKERHTCL